MEQYTRETKACLDERYRACDETGIYFAHQPIYGFRKGYSERGLIVRYMRTYQVIKALSHFDFTSLLDVGCAEGFQGYQIAGIFGVEVRCCDLSEEACKRAGEIFGLKADVADIHALPYDDGQFDMVTCSETLEHVADYKKAIHELLRVAKTGVVVTVPHEPERKIRKNIERRIPHGHIHRYTKDSFDFLEEQGCKVHGRRFISKLLTVPQSLIEATPLTGEEDKYPGWLVKAYNTYATIADKAIGDSLRKRVVALMLPGDEALCKLIPYHDGLVFDIAKEGARSYAERDFSVRQILDACVPYYYLGERLSG
jgi:SAM-dependent methyltransferase